MTWTYRNKHCHLLRRNPDNYRALVNIKLQTNPGVSSFPLQLSPLITFFPYYLLHLCLLPIFYLLSCPSLSCRLLSLGPSYSPSIYSIQDSSWCSAHWSILSRIFQVQTQLKLHSSQSSQTIPVSPYICLTLLPRALLRRLVICRGNPIRITLVRIVKLGSHSLSDHLSLARQEGAQVELAIAST